MGLGGGGGIKRRNFIDVGIMIVIILNISVLFKLTKHTIDPNFISLSKSDPRQVLL